MKPRDPEEGEGRGLQHDGKDEGEEDRDEGRETLSSCASFVPCGESPPNSLFVRICVLPSRLRMDRFLRAIPGSVVTSPDGRPARIIDAGPRTRPALGGDLPSGAVAAGVRGPLRRACDGSGADP